MAEFPIRWLWAAFPIAFVPERTSINASIPQDSEQDDAQVFPTEQKPTEHASRSIDQFDNYQKISAWIAGSGLLILGLSPFSKWIKLGAGGVTGLAGDGKILLAVTVLAAAAYSAAIVKRKWLTPVLLSVQAWGTIAMFWMGTLIWKVGSILDSPDMKDNPFAAMFSMMLISPGAGLYLGLIGGIAVAGALGFLVVRLLLTVRNLKPFYASQGIACALGILINVISRSRPHVDKRECCPKRCRGVVGVPRCEEGSRPSKMERDP